LKDSKHKKKQYNWHWHLLPVPVVMFVVLWLWAGVWMGDVFAQMRENAFFAPSKLLMEHFLNQDFGALLVFGRALLMLYA